VFGKMIPSEIFVPKGEELTGEWKELCKELHNVCTSQNTCIIKLRIRSQSDILNTSMWIKVPT
jgi:hypothetical protein